MTDLFTRVVYQLPKRIYSVKQLDQSALVLWTAKGKGDNINYHFINEIRLIKNISAIDNVTIDNGVNIIEHIKTSTNSALANRVSDYAISNTELFPGRRFIIQ